MPFFPAPESLSPHWQASPPPLRFPRLPLPLHQPPPLLRALRHSPPPASFLSDDPLPHNKPSWQRRFSGRRDCPARPHKADTFSPAPALLHIPARTQARSHSAIPREPDAPYRKIPRQTPLARRKRHRRSHTVPLFPDKSFPVHPDPHPPVAKPVSHKGSFHANPRTDSRSLPAAVPRRDRPSSFSVRRSFPKEPAP